MLGAADGDDASIAENTVQKDPIRENELFAKLHVLFCDNNNEISIINRLIKCKGNASPFNKADEENGDSNVITIDYRTYLQKVCDVLQPVFEKGKVDEEKVRVTKIMINSLHYLDATMGGDPRNVSDIAL